MYQDATTYISDLTNSYARDTALVFIQTFGKEENASKYSKLNKSIAFTKTGFNEDKYCNIHDLSGNVSEWSTETCKVSGFPSVFCGGAFNENSGRTHDASYRYRLRTSGINSGGTSGSLWAMSFRAILFCI